MKGSLPAVQRPFPRVFRPSAGLLPPAYRMFRIARMELPGERRELPPAPWRLTEKPLVSRFPAPPPPFAFGPWVSQTLTWAFSLLLPWELIVKPCPLSLRGCESHPPSCVAPCASAHLSTSAGRARAGRDDAEFRGNYRS